MGALAHSILYFIMHVPQMVSVEHRLSLREACEQDSGIFKRHSISISSPTSSLIQSHHRFFVQPIVQKFTGV